MQEAVQEKVQDQEAPRMTPEELESQMFDEAMALVDESEFGGQPQHEKEKDQADPVVEAEAEDPDEDQSGEAPKEAAAPPEPSEETTPDPQAWQNLVTEKARLEHEAMSNRNRVSGLQKKLNELQAKLDAQDQPKEKPAEKQVEAADNLAAADGDGDLKEFQEDFPEIYKAVNSIYKQQMTQMEREFNARLQQVNQQLESVAQPVQQMQQTEVDQYRRSQLEALKAAHPDWREIQDSQEFWGWVENQTDGIRALSGSVAAADNIALLNLYKSNAGQTVQKAPASNTRRKPKREPDVALPRTSAAARPRSGIPPQDGDGAFKYWMDHWDEI